MSSHGASDEESSSVIVDDAHNQKETKLDESSRASNEGNACVAPGTDRPNQEETKVDESSRASNEGNGCVAPGTDRPNQEETKVDESSRASNEGNGCLAPGTDRPNQEETKGGVSSSENKAKENNTSQSAVGTSSESSPGEGVNNFSWKCPDCSKTIASIRKVDQDTGIFNIQIQVQIKNEEVSSKANPNPAGEAMHFPIKCPYCSRENVSLMEIDLNTLNLQISLEPKNKSVSLDGNPTPGQKPKDGASWFDQLKHIIKVYCFCRGETFGTDETIMKKLKESNTWWKPLTTIEETKSLEDSSVNIVFCPIISRVGSDVKSAMGDPRVSASNKPVILVLMHHTRDADYSTGGKGWSEDYKNVELDVVHVLFHETVPGLLDCKQNEEAINSILQKLYSL